MIYKVITKRNYYYLSCENKQDAIMEANLKTSPDEILAIKREKDPYEGMLLGLTFALGFILGFLLYIYYINFF